MKFNHLTRQTHARFTLKQTVNNPMPPKPLSQTGRQVYWENGVKPNVSLIIYLSSREKVWPEPILAKLLFERPQELWSLSSTVAFWRRRPKKNHVLQIISRAQWPAIQLIARQSKSGVNFSSAIVQKPFSNEPRTVLHNAVLV